MIFNSWWSVDSNQVNPTCCFLEQEVLFTLLSTDWYQQTRSNAILKQNNPKQNNTNKQKSYELSSQAV